MATREIKRSMGIYSFLDRGSVVGRAISDDAECMYIHPFFRRRQSSNGRRQRNRQGAQRHSVIAHADGASHSFNGHDEPVVEILDLVNRAFAGNSLSTFAESSKGRYILQHGIFEADLGERTSFIADYDEWTGDILEAAVLDPELVGILGIDIDGGGYIAEGVANEGK